MQPHPIFIFILYLIYISTYENKYWFAFIVCKSALYNIFIYFISLLSILSN